MYIMIFTTMLKPELKKWSAQSLSARWARCVLSKGCSEIGKETNIIPLQASSISPFCISWLALSPIYHCHSPRLRSPTSSSRLASCCGRPEIFGEKKAKKRPSEWGCLMDLWEMMGMWWYKSLHIWPYVSLLDTFGCAWKWGVPPFYGNHTKDTHD